MTSEPDHTDLPDHLIPLDAEAATAAEVAGAKAAALAAARAAGLPVVAGVVVAVGAGALDAGALAPAWEQLSRAGRVPLVARSSSTAEDLESGSMAGRFHSEGPIRSLPELAAAVGRVQQSLDEVEDAPADAGMAVLLQRHVEAACGGVMFGVDPVSGDPDVLVVVASADGPGPVVDGDVQGTTYRLDAAGAVQERTPADGEQPVELDADRCTALARLASEVRDLFDGPQDLEWAFDTDARLWLLQSRPVTATAPAPRGGGGPVLGPGPVAETFPEPLAPLEEDLWLPPLRHALTQAFRLAGSVPPAALQRSPVARTVGGWVAVDLELFGLAPDGGDDGWWARLDPRPRLRRLRAAWRVGRVRGALPRLGRALVRRIDDDLAEVGPLHQLSDLQLLGLLDRAQRLLAAGHGHEILVGLVMDPGDARLTGTSVALRLLASARAQGLSDPQIVARHPVVLALLPPRIAAAPSLPPVDGAAQVRPEVRRDTGIGAVREALRLRARWLQELTARAAWLLGTRLHQRGALHEPADVRLLRLPELRALVRGEVVTWRGGRPTRRTAGAGAGPPLPAAFRLTDDDEIVPVGEHGGGTGAGGGRGSGPVTCDAQDPAEGSVLVVETLDPTLARHLPRLAGLVAETGSVLAHTAILAREQDVPVVVGCDGALGGCQEGDVVVVDGQAGTVTPRDTDGGSTSPEEAAA